MKVTYTVWLDKYHHSTHERTINSGDIDGLLRDFDQACELREARAEVYELKKKLEVVYTPKVADGVDLLLIAQPDRDDGPHKRVYEYDGAMNCLDCHALWGALPGKPAMPTLCLTERINAL